MHGEALVYMRQTIDYPSPWPMRLPALTGADDDAAIAAGRFEQGCAPDDGFVFDNEKWRHEVVLGAFRIARRCVSNASFAAFVVAGGYRDSRWWCDEGRARLADAWLADHPPRWRRGRNG